MSHLDSFSNCKLFENLCQSFLRSSDKYLGQTCEKNLIVDYAANEADGNTELCAIFKRRASAT